MLHDTKTGGKNPITYRYGVTKLESYFFFIEAFCYGKKAVEKRAEMYMICFDESYTVRIDILPSLVLQCIIFVFPIERYLIRYVLFG